MDGAENEPVEVVATFVKPRRKRKQASPKHLSCYIGSLNCVEEKQEDGIDAKVMKQKEDVADSMASVTNSVETDCVGHEVASSDSSNIVVDVPETLAQNDDVVKEQKNISAVDKSQSNPPEEEIDDSGSYGDVSETLAWNYDVEDEQMDNSSVDLSHLKESDTEEEVKDDVEGYGDDLETLPGNYDVVDEQMDNSSVDLCQFKKSDPEEVALDGTGSSGDDLKTVAQSGDVVEEQMSISVVHLCHSEKSTPAEEATDDVESYGDALETFTSNNNGLDGQMYMSQFKEANLEEEEMDDTGSLGDASEMATQNEAVLEEDILPTAENQINLKPKLLHLMAFILPLIPVKVFEDLNKKVEKKIGKTGASDIINIRDCVLNATNVCDILMTPETEKIEGNVRLVLLMKLVSILIGDLKLSQDSDLAKYLKKLKDGQIDKTTVVSNGKVLAVLDTLIDGLVPI